MGSFRLVGHSYGLVMTLTGPAGIGPTLDTTGVETGVGPIEEVVG
jgi:hypothetical protein